MRVDEIVQLLQYRRNGGWIGYLGTPAGRAEVAHGDMPCRITATSGGGVGKHRGTAELGDRDSDAERIQGADAGDGHAGADERQSSGLPRGAEQLPVGGGCRAPANGKLRVGRRLAQWRQHWAAAVAGGQLGRVGHKGGVPQPTVALQAGTQLLTGDGRREGDGHRVRRHQQRLAQHPHHGDGEVHRQEPPRRELLEVLSPGAAGKVHRGGEGAHGGELHRQGMRAERAYGLHASHSGPHGADRRRALHLAGQRE
mmetsp:Transcript_37350/g.93770  ORF Transcript_37350/g.93770 Transcript_37350/m.93770 type:complete len:255 (+) Transcript_37350:3-767(+)